MDVLIPQPVPVATGASSHVAASSSSTGGGKTLSDRELGRREDPMFARVLAGERRLFELKKRCGLNAAAMPEESACRPETVALLKKDYLSGDFATVDPDEVTVKIAGANASEHVRAVTLAIEDAAEFADGDRYRAVMAKVQTQLCFLGAAAVESVLLALIHNPPRDRGARSDELWLPYLVTVQIGLEHSGFGAAGAGRLASFSRGRQGFGALVVEQILSHVLVLEKGVEGRTYEMVLRLADVFVPLLSEQALIDLVTLLVGMPPVKADGKGDASYYHHFLNKWLGAANLGPLFESLAGKQNVEAGPALRILDYIETYREAIPDANVSKIANNMTAFLAHANPKVRFRYRSVISRFFAQLPDEKKSLVEFAVLERCPEMSPAVRTEAGEFLKSLHAESPRGYQLELLFRLAQLLKGVPAASEPEAFFRDLFAELFAAVDDPREAFAHLTGKMSLEEDALCLNLLRFLRANLSRVEDVAQREALVESAAARLNLALPADAWDSPEARLDALMSALLMERVKLAFARSNVLDEKVPEPQRQDELDKIYSLVGESCREIPAAFAEAAYRRFRDAWAAEGNFAGRFWLFVHYGLPPDFKMLEEFLYTPRLPTYLKKTLRQPELYASGRRADPAFLAGYYARAGERKRAEGDLAGAASAYRAALSFDGAHEPSLKALGEILDQQKAPAAEIASLRIAAYRAKPGEDKAISLFDAAAADGEGAEALRKILETEFPDAKIRLAGAYARRAEKEADAAKKLALLERARDGAPDDVAVLEALAAVYETLPEREGDWFKTLLRLAAFDGADPLIEDKILSLYILRGDETGFDAAAALAHLSSPLAEKRSPEAHFLAGLWRRLKNPAERAAALKEFAERRSSSATSSRFAFFDVLLAERGWVPNGVLDEAAKDAAPVAVVEVNPELKAIFARDMDEKFLMESLLAFVERDGLKLTDADMIYLLEKMPLRSTWKVPGAWDPLMKAIVENGGTSWATGGNYPLDAVIVLKGLRKIHRVVETDHAARLSKLVTKSVEGSVLWGDRKEDFKAEAMRVFIREIQRVAALAPDAKDVLVPGAALKPHPDLENIFANLSDPKSQLDEVQKFVDNAERLADQDLYLILEKLPRGQGWGYGTGLKDLRKAMREAGLTAPDVDHWESLDVDIVYKAMRKVKTVSQPGRLKNSLSDINRIMESAYTWKRTDEKKWDESFRRALMRFFFAEHAKLLKIPARESAEERRARAVAKMYLDIFKDDPSCITALHALKDLSRRHDVAPILAEAERLAK